MKFQAEYTDTFGGEANYAWVRRVEFDAPDAIMNKPLVAKAKAALGLTGIRGRIDYAGNDTIAYIPNGMNTILFVTPA